MDKMCRLPLCMCLSLSDSIVLNTRSIAIVAIPWIALAVAGVVLLVYLCRLVYIPTSRQLRSLEASAKTPLYAASGQISKPEGLKLVRAYQREAYRSTAVSRAITQANARASHFCADVPRH